MTILETLEAVASYLANGGQVTHCPPAIAAGALRCTQRRMATQAGGLIVPPSNAANAWLSSNQRVGS